MTQKRKQIFTRVVRRVSSHFEYLENRSSGLGATWKPVRGDQPPESGIGGVGNKRVTSKRDQQYQRLEGEVCIFCRWQGCQDSRKSHDRLSCGLNQSQDGYFKFKSVVSLFKSGAIVLVCGDYLSSDIRLVVWLKFHFCRGTAVSSICVM